jgi:hypothetical protein
LVGDELKHDFVAGDMYDSVDQALDSVEADD